MSIKTISNKKILYGICGIGNGHIYRQIPILERLSLTNKIAILAYKNSFLYFSKAYKNNKNIIVIEIDVPFIIGDFMGINFKESYHINKNKSDYNTNLLAMYKVQNFIGKPDFCISDYEPISAQYSYCYNIPLFTFDQQSKYLLPNFPEKIGHYSLVDERMRLNMFFPKVTLRFACSFFPIKTNNKNLKIVPCFMRKEIAKIYHQRGYTSNILIYISSFHKTISSDKLKNVVQNFPDITFHIIGPSQMSFKSKNTQWYNYGDKNYLKLLSRCMGVITTAGHSLLSELIYLEKPMYIVPGNNYEQHMNASMIGTYKLGAIEKNITINGLKRFIKNLGLYQSNIKKYNKKYSSKNDVNVLLNIIQKHL